MKIAYCFAGHLRTGRDNPSVLKYLMEPNPGDVFIHTYGVRDLPKDTPAWHSDRAGAGEPLSDDDVSWIKQTYKPVALRIDEQPHGGVYMPKGCEIMGVRYSYGRSNELRRTYEQESGAKYDVVFLARFDLLLFEPFKFPEIEPNVLYGSYNLNMIERGFDGDVFTYASPEVTNKMVDPIIPDAEIDKIPSYGLMGEMLTTSIRKSHGFEYKPHRVPLGLLRSNGPMMVRT